jgi:glycosyltransferase involved in cell wall biosynthesis
MSLDLSIVTIARNNLQGIKKTLQSIQNQVTPPTEVIVIDGNSTDRTKEFLSDFSHQEHPFKFSFISESDKGISDAFNKGVQMASCTWIQFLNSSDIFTDLNSLTRIKEALQNTQAKIVCAGIRQFSGGTLVEVYSKKRKSSVDDSIRLCHPATFCQRALFDQVGLFNLSFKIGMDTEWFLRAERLLGTQIFQMVETIITDMEPGGISQSASSRRQRELLAARLLHSRRPTSQLMIKYMLHMLSNTVNLP